MNNQSTSTETAVAGTQPEFHVTYFDADCGRARMEIFETAAEAERFASRWCSDEDSWAVVDVVDVVETRLAA